MGEYAEIAWQRELARGRYDPRPRGPVPRNEVAAHCPHCGKGIRPIAGRIEESMAQHVKAKHPEEF